ncbi:HET-domain-containing protein, partial [Lepidopterella palustris CBS 459.81]
PTRLLDVGKSGPTIRLETEFSADFNEHYLTLSHCWGGADVPILTVGTVQKFSAGIQIISLPKTFRDAVKATRELGIRYLWIDSICIIQDSQFDWRAESAKMREVYSNALCNLAALGGENSHSGLFFDRSLEQLMHLRPLWIHKRIPGSPFVSSYKLIDRWKQLEKFEKSPLVKRAWVMQERFLAPRVVYFGREELYWECKSRMASESLQEDCCERCYPSYFLKTQYKHFTDAGFRNNWYEILDSYTQMQLTYPSDILIALSGIAKDFQQFNLDEYVVGMWKRSLLSDLCWEVDMPGRPSTYRAPSWSWASLHGRVT